MCQQTGGAARPGCDLDNQYAYIKTIAEVKYNVQTEVERNQDTWLIYCIMMQPYLAQSQNCLHSQPIMSGTQLWLSEPIPNDDTVVTGLELATYDYGSCILTTAPYIFYSVPIEAGRLAEYIHNVTII